MDRMFASAFDCTFSSSPVSDLNYTLTLNAGSISGTFNIAGGSIGSGTYTYSANGNVGAVTLNYTSQGAIGDQDVMNLAFNSPTSGTFTGNTTANKVQYNTLTGTFDSAR